jgi:hypothetical protein
MVWPLLAGMGLVQVAAGEGWHLAVLVDALAGAPVPAAAPEGRVMSRPTVAELAAEVAQLRNEVAALRAIAGIFYEAGRADEAAPVKLAEIARSTREDVLALARRQQMRRVQ